MAGTGVVSACRRHPAVYDQNQSAGSQVQYCQRSGASHHPAPFGRRPRSRAPPPPSAAKLLRTPDGQHIVGVITPRPRRRTSSSNEVAFGRVLQNRTISGASSVLSMGPNGSRSWPGSPCSTSALWRLSRSRTTPTTVRIHRRGQHVAEHRWQHLLAGRLPLYSAFNTARTSHRRRRQSSTLLVNIRQLAIRLGSSCPRAL